ncbi:MAG: ABC transporter ATP-binding protein [Erysipelotrichaceae bacterium]|nr:ABC transporter ATP-binding protein [Erysipelotrichaceae bacterium]MCI9311910.1 ABC transporter ATP-binding protein [Erysipelotrichaceae bacterium]
MHLILTYLKRYKKLFVLNVASVFGFALVELGIPTIVAQMVDQGVAKQDEAYLYQMGAVIALISVIGVAGTVLLGYCCAKISTSITRDMRNDIFARVQGFSRHEINTFGVSSLITRTNNDAFQIQMFVNVLLRTALMTPVMAILSMIMTIRASLPLALIIGATIPFIILGVYLVARFSEPISEKQQASIDALNRISRENLTGIRVIRAFNNDAYESDRFNTTNHAYMGHSKRLFKLMMITQPIFFFLMNLASIAIYWIAAGLIDQGTLPVGQLIAFNEYLFHAMFSMMLFCTVFMMYPRAAVSAKRIEAVLQTTTSVKEAQSGITLDDVHEITFDHVTFAYPDGEEPVLKDVSFTVKKGEKLAFIGSTGSGKSTLINLIPRFYDVSGGAIMIDGINVKALDLSTWRDQLGFIAQKANLFSGTIADNIRFGKEDADQKELEHAAQIAQAYDFIMEKENGFAETISEGASNLSGGQKQRLSIARALVRKPKVYIFDDSFSALDFKTDAKLRQALKAETQAAITMVVAQRISTIMDADQIIVLHEGEMVGCGTHQELLKACPIYHEIAASQLSEEELAHE